MKELCFRWNNNQGLRKKCGDPKLFLIEEAKDVVFMESLNELGDLIDLRIFTKLKDKVETSLYTMAGSPSLKTIQLKAKINNQILVVLIIKHI